LQLAVNTCRDSKALPPTLPQLVEICKSIQKPSPFIKAAPFIKSGISEVAENNLAQIKKILSGPTARS
jgi:hypothetical protein